MPKRRPFFEYKGLAGLIDSINHAAAREPSFHSDNVPYTNEADASRQRRRSHHHHHRSGSRSHSRSRSRTRTRTRTRSRTRTHSRSHSRPRSHHHHHHYHHYHRGSRRHRRDRTQDDDAKQQASPSRGNHPSTRPPQGLDDDDHRMSSPEPSYTQHQSSANLRAERAAQAKAAATAAAVGMGGAAAAGMAINSGKNNQHNYNDQDDSPAGPPSDIDSQGDNEIDQQPQEYPQPYSQRQQHAPGRPLPAQSLMSQALQEEPPKTLPQRFIEGVRNLFPRRYQQASNANGYMFLAGENASQSQHTIGGVTQRLAAQQAVTQSGATQTGATQTAAAMTTQPAGAVSEMMMTSRPPSDGKSKDEINKEKRGRQFKTAVKIGLGLAGAYAMSKLASRWLKNRKKKSKGGDTEDSDSDDEDEDNEERHSKSGTGGGSTDIGGGGGRGRRAPHPLKLKPPNALFSAKAPQGESFIIERSGKFHREVSGGSTMLIPWMDKVAFRHTRREFGFPLRPTECFTRDSVGVDVSALMFLRVEDAVAASYEVANLNHSLQLMGLSVMRKEIAGVPLTELFSKRDGLTEHIVRTMNGAIRPWGLRCTRFEFEHLDLPPDIRDSMEREARAERLRHADILFSEGQRQALINKADAEMQAQMRMSQARQMDIVNQAIGEAHAIQERGEAIANAMRDVAEVVNEPGGQQALRLRIAEQYYNAYSMANQGSDEVSAGLPVQQQTDPTQLAEGIDHQIRFLNSLGDPSGNGATANPYMVPTNNNPNRPSGNVHSNPYQHQPQYQAQPPTEKRRQRPRPPPAPGGTINSPPSPQQYDMHPDGEEEDARLPPHASGLRYGRTIIVDGDDEDEDESLYAPGGGSGTSGRVGSMSRYDRYHPGDERFDEEHLHSPRGAGTGGRMESSPAMRGNRRNEYIDDEEGDEVLVARQMRSPPKQGRYYAAASSA